MGANSWEYFVPYQEDVLLALQNLREQVFVSGDYDRAYLAENFCDWQEWEDDTGFHAEGILRIKEPETFEDFNKLVAEYSFIQTSSILDMDGLASKPQVRRLTRFPEEIEMSIFGTKRPTKTMVENAYRTMALGIVGSSQKYHGHYVVVYDNDTPSELFFFGWSSI